MAEPLSLQSTFTLNSGYKIPLLGFGVWQTPQETADEVVTAAFEVGYRHIDSAAAYRNEKGCGAAIRKSSIPRSDIFFTSKVPSSSISYDGAKNQVDLTLKETGLDYIDLILLHAPFGGSENRKGAWKALVEAVEAGKVRSIGVSNYGVKHLEELQQHIAELEAERGKGKGGVLSVGQWEIHPWCARNDIADWARKHNVAIEAYSPLVRGQRWGEETLKRLADKHGVTEAQILIRWSLDKGYIPLPKSVTNSRIKANADVFGFTLSKSELDELETDAYAPVCWDPTVRPLDQ